jgi:hypothetical protein
MCQRIRSRFTGTFSQRAGDAGEGEVCGFRLATSRRGDHVIHVKDGFLSRLREPAIFASPVRPLDNGAAKLARNIHQVRLCYLPLKRTERI